MRARRRIGILAIQGDVQAHGRSVERLGCEAVPVLRGKDLQSLDALILPGGESTTIAKGLDRLGLYRPLREVAQGGLPMLGTCAGAILMGRQVEEDRHPVESLGLLDVVSVRNAYGTQVDSFAAEVDPGAAPGLEGLRCVFIRAPRLRDSGSEVEVLARVDGSPVLVRQGRLLAATFHPELTDDLRVHSLLLAHHPRHAVGVPCGQGGSAGR
jgi:5'-phosphate synthase pdxT subunit